jgi:hypothetical protein
VAEELQVVELVLQIQLLKKGMVELVVAEDKVIQVEGLVLLVELVDFQVEVGEEEETHQLLVEQEVQVEQDK